jgi:hypothetical protein
MLNPIHPSLQKNEEIFLANAQNFQSNNLPLIVLLRGNKSEYSRLSIGNIAHIDGGNSFSVILQKGLPALRWRVPNSHHVCSDRTTRFSPPSSSSSAGFGALLSGWITGLLSDDQPSQSM